MPSKPKCNTALEDCKQHLRRKITKLFVCGACMKIEARDRCGRFSFSDKLGQKEPLNLVGFEVFETIMKNLMKGNIFLFCDWFN